ncbi:MAG TPA: hydroxymethylbilane synthase [Tepidisphaeraceae bacterium]|jgi:hydroxymethylbilane synthase
MTATLRLGTRGSMLARLQSQQTADLIEKANPDCVVELVIVKTTGDQVQDRPLADLGGKGLFTKEIEQALLRGDIDLAVHSYKDVPVTMPLVDASDLIIAAVPAREDARDVLVAAEGMTLDTLPQGARVGTGSLRRRTQLLAARGDLQVLGLRGNIDSRLSRQRSGEYDAIVLAMAGLRRGGLYDGATMTALPPEIVTPAAGQGALAVQCRADHAAARAAVAPLHDADTARCVDAERAVVLAMNADCHSPIGVYATLAGGEMSLMAVYTAGNGPPHRASATGPDAVRRVSRQLSRLRPSFGGG